MNLFHFKIAALSLMLLPMLPAKDSMAYSKDGHARLGGGAIRPLYCDPPEDRTCYKSDGPNKPIRGEWVKLQLQDQNGDLYWKDYQVYSDQGPGDPPEGEPEFYVTETEIETGS